MPKQQLLVFRPDLEPRRQARKTFLAMSPLHEPVDAPAGIGFQLRFDQIEINPQLPVDFGGQPVLDDFIDKNGEDRQDNRRGCGVPDRKPQLQRAAFPPVLHAAFSSRKTNPAPRNVWMSLVPCPSSIFFRKWARWTSITLSRGVTRCGSRQTSLASICRVTVWPWCCRR